MEVRIPKSFKLFNSTITVKYANEFCIKNNALGMCDVDHLSIVLANTSPEGKIYKNDVILDTLYHEKVHMILKTMGENKLSSNEKFVDIFGKLLRQSDETAKY